MNARDLLDLAWVIPALPAFGAVVLLLFGKRLGEPLAGWIGTLMMALAFVASVIAFGALFSLTRTPGRTSPTATRGWRPVGSTCSSGSSSTRCRRR